MTLSNGHPREEHHEELPLWRRAAQFADRMTGITTGTAALGLLNRPLQGLHEGQEFLRNLPGTVANAATQLPFQMASGASRLLGQNQIATQFERTGQSVGNAVQEGVRNVQDAPAAGLRLVSYGAGQLVDHLADSGHATVNAAAGLIRQGAHLNGEMNGRMMDAVGLNGVGNFMRGVGDAQGDVLSGAVRVIGHSNVGVLDGAAHCITNIPEDVAGVVRDPVGTVQNVSTLLQHPAESLIGFGAGLVNSHGASYAVGNVVTNFLNPEEAALGAARVAARGAHVAEAAHGAEIASEAAHAARAAHEGSELVETAVSINGQGERANYVSELNHAGGGHRQSTSQLMGWFDNMRNRYEHQREEQHERLTGIERWI